MGQQDGCEDFALTKAEYLPHADTVSPSVKSGQEYIKNADSNNTMLMCIIIVAMLWLLL